MASTASYHVIAINSPSTDTDFISGVLHTLGCLGIEEVSDSQPGLSHLKTYFDETLSLPLLLKNIKERIGPDSQVEGITISLNTTPFQAQTFEPIELVENVWIVPPNDMPTETKIESGEKLIIRPGAAFGTGRHESTQLSAEAIQSILPLLCPSTLLRMVSLSNHKEGLGEVDRASTKSLLDVGTGSGILAIFATMKGFRPVNAVEIDAEGRMNATENFELNNLSIQLFEDISQVKEKQDVIVANILAPTIIHLKPQIEFLLKPKGVMIFSGIVESEGEQIEKNFAAYKLVRRLKKNEWVCYTYEECSGVPRMLA